MKKIIWLLFIVFEFNLMLFSQNFAPPIGATWHYEYRVSPFTNDDRSYMKAQYINDTIIENKNCINIERTLYDVNNDPSALDNEILYIEDSVLYGYNNNEFKLLFDYKALPGDTVNIEYVAHTDENYTLKIVIDSISFLSTEATPLKRYHFHYILENSNPLTWGNSFTERLASNAYLKPENQLYCDYDFCYTFRCYSDNDYNILNPDKDCEMIVTGLNFNETRGLNSIIIYPNPITTRINISNLPKECTIQIFDVYGKIISVHSGYQNTYIDMSNYNSGIYVIKILNMKNSIYKYIIKN